MFEKLEAYLEEISHYLSVPQEREEILSEIKSHILEKAEREFGEVNPASVDKVIAAYGPPRRVADKYLDGQQIISPVFKRYLFRYTALLFAAHFMLTAAAVIFKKSFLMFPLLYVPSMAPFEALFYLPMAFLFDLGVVTLVLYLITQSRKDIRLPWPKLGVDIDEMRVPKRSIMRVLALIVMLGVTGFAIYLYARYGSIFFINLNFTEHNPLFTPQAGRWFSLVVITMFATGTLSLLIKLFTSSPWVDVVKNGISLVLIGLLFRVPIESAFSNTLPEKLLRVIRLNADIILIIAAAIVAVELIKSLILIGRKHLAK